MLFPSWVWTPSHERIHVGGGGICVRTPGPWELVVIESGTKPLLEGLNLNNIRRVVNKMMGGGGSKSGDKAAGTWGAVVATPGGPNSGRCKQASKEVLEEVGEGGV